MSAPCRYIALCKASEIEPGTAIKVETDGLELAVFNLDGEYFVTNDTCTHGPGSLSEGDIEGDKVVCDFHSGSFNIRTGEPMDAPCIIPIKVYKTRLEDGTVTIEAES